ncbi:MAG: hypothetical protein ACTSQD_09585 [Promethearchaeota archaeon]|jgi:hypothetical protein
MEKGNLDKILSKIKGIEKKNIEFQKLISTLEIPSRNNMLKEISNDIIRNNKLFKELQVETTGIIVAKKEIENISNYNLIEETVLNIQNNPSKKIIFLREFLNKMEGISENDKDVLLQSLNDEKIELEELKEKMLSLANIFNLKI